MPLAGQLCERLINSVRRERATERRASIYVFEYVARVAENKDASEGQVPSAMIMAPERCMRAGA